MLVLKYTIKIILKHFTVINQEQHCQEEGEGCFCPWPAEREDDLLLLIAKWMCFACVIFGMIDKPLFSKMFMYDT